ncbi:MAG: carboxypeptidase regulatory-like domain-containing protein, partial [Sphingobacteriales bacterium]
MKRYILLFLISLISIAAAAQNRAGIKAVVLDSLNKEPLGFATVAVLKVSDSSLISYTITDKTGAFSLRNLNTAEPSRLLISRVGYQSLHLTLSFKKDKPVNDLGQLFLAQKVLKEVTITAERTPVLIKKDTIEFNAEAFKVRPNAVVEDLLKKLPGVQVDNGGTITVNGKNISKIKVDGKDFFANDPKIAT